MNEEELQQQRAQFAWGGNSAYSGGNYERFSARKRQFDGEYGSHSAYGGYAKRSRFQKRYDEDGYEIEPNTDNDFPAYDDIPPVSSLYAKPKSARPSLADPRRVPGFIQQTQPSVPGPKNEDGLALGGKVKHGVFGEGKIVQIAGSGESAKITVAFANGTRRTFMLKFAPLEIL